MCQDHLKYLFHDTEDGEFCQDCTIIQKLKIDFKMERHSKKMKTKEECNAIDCKVNKDLYCCDICKGLICIDHLTDELYCLVCFEVLKLKLQSQTESFHSFSKKKRSAKRIEKHITF
jgi:hypothetical protein